MVGEWGDRLRRGPGAGSAPGAQPAAESMSPLLQRDGLALPPLAHKHGVRPTYGPELEGSASSLDEDR